MRLLYCKLQYYYSSALVGTEDAADTFIVWHVLGFFGFLGGCFLSVLLAVLVCLL
jgi:hypothetical protein